MAACWCGQETKLDQQARPRTHVYELDGVPFMYLLMFECRCGTTRSLPLYQDTECAAEELANAAHEQAGAEQYERELGAFERASVRPFFSVTHELAERGL